MKIGNLEVYGVIYKITNKVNGKIYIGQTTNKRGFNGRYDSKGKGITRVYNYYLKKEKNGGYCNKHLLNSIKNYGIESFEICEIFDIAFTKEELDVKESTYILLYDSIYNGYNKKEGGSKGKLTDETKRKLSDINKGEKHPMFNIKGREHPLYCKKELICDGCGKVFLKAPCNIKENNYCSRECVNSDEDNKKRISEKLKLNYRNGYMSPVEKEVYCLTTQETFPSVTSASLFYKIDESSITKCCKLKRKSAGKHPYTNQKLVWIYK